MTMFTPAEIETAAEEFAEMKISRFNAPNVEVGLAYEVAKATAIEVLEYALPRLGGDRE